VSVFTTFYPKRLRKASILAQCDLNLPSNNIDMNIQEVITPIGKFTEWTFENVLVPMSDPFNAGVIILGLVSLVVWLKVLNSYVAKAKEDGVTP